MMIKKLQVYFIVALLIIGSAFINAKINVYAAESITINNTILTFDSVYYVDSNNGDDTNADGSKTNPYATLEKAHEVLNDSNNEAIVLLSSITTKDQFKISKSCSIIGNEYTWNYSYEAPHESALVASNVDVKFYQIIFDIQTGTWTYMGRSIKNVNVEFYNCVFLQNKNRENIFFGIYNATNLHYKFENCLFDTMTSYNVTLHVSAIPISTVINCADANSEQDIFDLTKVEYDNQYKISSEGWQNTGTGTNPDGTQANIGVYGGEFAWGEWISETLNLDVEAPNYEIQGGTEFETFVVIREASNIYAKDIDITYDSNLFELINAVSVDSSTLKIYHQETATLGEGRYIVASKGAENGINGDAQILKLIFKAKNINGQGDIGIASGLVADGDGNEITPVCLSKVFTVTSDINGDVNKDGKFTLGDLAIAGRLFNTTFESWEDYEPDVDESGNVEDIDLATIVQLILANENN